MTILATLQSSDTRRVHDSSAHIYTCIHMSHTLHHTVERENRRSKRVHALCVPAVMIVGVINSRGRLVA